MYIIKKKIYNLIVCLLNIIIKINLNLTNDLEYILRRFNIISIELLLVITNKDNII